MSKNVLVQFVCVAFLLSAASCARLPIDAAFQNLQVSNPADTAMFAVIGDFGEDGPHEEAVAKMVAAWNPQFIITVGDNNYPMGGTSTITDNIGKHYGDFIYNPDAPLDKRCTGKATTDKVNRFFPSPGNHDHYTLPVMRSYTDYFTLPGDERNYDFTWGPVQFFSMTSGAAGTLPQQARNWLKDKAAQSIAPFQLVYFHHPPYSPGPHGSSAGTQLPYSDWGLDAVVCGHEHFYSRVTDKAAPKLPYIIIGNSGNDNLYSCNAHPLDPDKYTVNICDNERFGAVKVKATTTQMIFEYYTTDQPNIPRDIYVVYK
ncbi:MAG TPA: metallophosphoesterase [Chitinophagales bacterium]|nr:metallophosphoesterase [Chitinophagales bacterium]